MSDQVDKTQPTGSRIFGGIGRAAVAYGLKLPRVVGAGLCIAVWLVIYVNRRKLVDW